MRRVVGLVLLLFIAACSNQGTKPEDKVTPGRVTDLAVVGVEDSTVTLAWTAPGDNGTVGTTRGYELRWMNSPITEPDWTAAEVAGPVPMPSVAGTRETAVLFGVPPGAMRYFALKSWDEAGNWSIISNNDAKAWLGAPVCRVDPDSLDFGSVPLGQWFEREFVIHNDGGGTLRTVVASGWPTFVLQSGGGTIALRHGGRQTVRVRYTPTSPGEENCWIEPGTCPTIHCFARAVSASPISTVEIPVGDVFAMGSLRSEAGHDTVDERSHPVRLTHAYLAATHEVTQAEWLTVMGWNESNPQRADLPVSRITWYDAIEFCNRLSDRDGYTRVYDIGEVIPDGNHIVSAGVSPHWRTTGYRLPSEAEWEFACRAGTTGATFRGDLTYLSCTPADPVLDAIAWYCGNAQASAGPVGLRDANPWGLHDVLGNVFEWTWDRYDPDYGLDFPAPPAEPDSVIADPIGPDEGESRVCRGGSWMVTPRECRAAYRLYHPAGNAYDDVGLRVVLTRS